MPDLAEESTTNTADVASVESDETGEHRCRYCGRRFAETDLLALHRGLDHERRLTDAERDAFETAYAAEEEGIRLFRLKALLALMLIYFLLLFAYSIFG